jgi:hypothetical protein
VDEGGKQAMTELAHRIAKQIFQILGYHSADRADELFAIYRTGPKNLEPEFMVEIKEAYESANAAISILTEHYSARLDGLEVRIRALEALKPQHLEAREEISEAMAIRAFQVFDQHSGNAIEAMRAALEAVQKG